MRIKSKSMVKLVCTACTVIRKIEIKHDDLLRNLTLNIYHEMNKYQFKSGDGDNLIICNYANKIIAFKYSESVLKFEGVKEILENI